MVFAMVLCLSEYEQLTNIHFTFTFSDPDLLVVRVFGCAHPSDLLLKLMVGYMPTLVKYRGGQ